MTLNIGYFYPDHLNLYGDNGNIEILVRRASMRDISVNVTRISVKEKVTSLDMKNINLLFMGGGPDSSQKLVYEDLIKNKGSYISDYIESGGVGLFICGAYQLLGHFYKAADGTIVDGLGIFDMYTQHFGNHKPRCIGNLVCEINKELRQDTVFSAVNKIGPTLVGFENHGGRTYLGQFIKPFSQVSTGFGNNGEDNTEGVFYKSSIGTYMHGPILAKNPHLADYLIAKSLEVSNLPALPDELILTAHNTALTYKQ